MSTRRYAIGYSTCGFPPGRDIFALIETLGRLGYEAVELELDRARLHPEAHSDGQAFEVAEACRRHGLRLALGTGGRHVLSPRRHEPGCVSQERAHRRRWLEFIKRSTEMAAVMQAECVMLHSGYTPVAVPTDTAWGWLVEGAAELAQHAQQLQQRLAFEWHPEMFLRTADDFRRLAAAVDSPALGCTLDVGHAHCTETASLPEVIASLAPQTRHVQLEDMRDRVHKHLRLGEGEIDFPEVFAAFDRSGFSGIVALEFNAGDIGGDGEELAAQSINFLRERVPSLRHRP